MNTLIKQALERLVHLNLCEQEGLSSGQPTPEMWMEAVNQASEALQSAQSLQRPGWVKEVRSFVEGLVSGYDCENDFHKYQNGIGCRVCDAKKILKLMDEGGSDGWISVEELDAMTREKDYWYNRCYHAEQFIEKSPGDPDIYDEQIIAHQKWQESKKR
jgi:hypothetical protein